MNATTSRKSKRGKWNAEIQRAVPHTLSQQDARKLLDRFIEEVIVKKFQDSVGDLEQHWEGDALAFRFKTFGIRLPESVPSPTTKSSVDGDLPFTAMMFKGKIESEIREQLERLMTSGIIEESEVDGGIESTRAHHRGVDRARCVAVALRLEPGRREQRIEQLVFIGIFHGERNARRRASGRPCAMAASSTASFQPSRWPSCSSTLPTGWFSTRSVKTCLSAGCCDEACDVCRRRPAAQRFDRRPIDRHNFDRPLVPAATR